MNDWSKYERKAVPAEMRPYQPGEDLTGVSVGDDDRKNGSPKEGDMIARDPSNHEDLWLVNAEYFEAKFHTTPVDAAEDGGDRPGEDIFEAAISIGAIEAHPFDENKHENLEYAEDLEPGYIVYIRKRLK